MTDVEYKSFFSSKTDFFEALIVLQLSSSVIVVFG